MDIISRTNSHLQSLELRIDNVDEHGAIVICDDEKEMDELLDLLKSTENTRCPSPVLRDSLSQENNTSQGSVLTKSVNKKTDNNGKSSQAPIGSSALVDKTQGTQHAPTTANTNSIFNKNKATVTNIISDMINSTKTPVQQVNKEAKQASIDKQYNVKTINANKTTMVLNAGNNDVSSNTPKKVSPLVIKKVLIANKNKVASPSISEDKTHVAVNADGKKILLKRVAHPPKHVTSKNKLICKSITKKDQPETPATPKSGLNSLVSIKVGDSQKTFQVVEDQSARKGSHSMVSYVLADGDSTPSKSGGLREALKRCAEECADSDKKKERVTSVSLIKSFEAAQEKEGTEKRASIDSGVVTPKVDKQMINKTVANNDKVAEKKTVTSSGSKEPKKLLVTVAKNANNFVLKSVNGLKTTLVKETPSKEKNKNETEPKVDKKVPQATKKPKEAFTQVDLPFKTLNPVVMCQNIGDPKVVLNAYDTLQQGTPELATKQKSVDSNKVVKEIIGKQQQLDPDLDTKLEQDGARIGSSMGNRKKKSPSSTPRNSVEFDKETQTPEGNLKLYPVKLRSSGKTLMVVRCSKTLQASLNASKQGREVDNKEKGDKESDDTVKSEDNKECDKEEGDKKSDDKDKEKKTPNMGYGSIKVRNISELLAPKTDNEQIKLRSGSKRKMTDNDSGNDSDTSAKRLRSKGNTSPNPSVLNPALASTSSKTGDKPTPTELEKLQSEAMGSFCCDFCSKRYKKERFLTEHVALKHKNEDLMFCPDCYFYTKTEEKMIEHKETMHASFGQKVDGDTDRTRCHLCSMIVNRKNFVRHLKNVHWTITCKCGIEFRYKVMYTKHIEDNPQCA
ncbi:uncharacterized protein LOC109602331 [Aethina tumida]|uniref:uncharacterized protein LOC109602331 n=1 Tax=Aethina tumida TaxID=116153 RepID=UPI0021491F39|nr:uncharacterized protein LOC109602331 [Aethina tumida]